MVDDGYASVANVDISPVVIKAMKEKTAVSEQAGTAAAVDPRLQREERRCADLSSNPAVRPSVLAP